MKHILFNQEGVCPYCHAVDQLEYKAMELIDEFVVYPYKCTNCETEGREYYVPRFYSHLIKKGGDEIIVEETMTVDINE